MTLGMSTMNNGMRVEHVIKTVFEVFQRRGHEKYGVEHVTQMQHALHCAQLAIRDGASDELIVAALLHDIGHVLDDETFPGDLSDNLHDHHEERGWAFLNEFFPAVVADSVRLHVLAKRWLCTVDPSYAGLLSPTSYKSYLDQGGPMSDEECRAFLGHPHCKAAVLLRRWDDLGKDPHAKLPLLEELVPRMERVLAGHTRKSD